MSTRSAIIEKLPNGRYRGIYCHFDGYPEGVGAVLAEHYTDPAKVSRLIELGAISACYERVEPTGKREHTFDNPEEGTTIAYHRDRGEEKHGPRDGSLKDVVASIGHNGYVYVFDGAWLLNGESLAEQLARGEEVQS
jgi:hypothetical protein